jgi:hypothetical protein
MGSRLDSSTSFFSLVFQSLPPPSQTVVWRRVCQNVVAIRPGERERHAAAAAAAESPCGRTTTFLQSVLCRTNKEAEP